MRVVIDADGCPVVNIAADCARKHNIECVLVCDTSHVFNIEGVKTITVSQGSDSADFKIVNLINGNDIVVTQDYGLAAMCLSKDACVINQNGLIYDENNIDGLLSSRHINKKIRLSGGRTKGPNKRKPQQNDEFLKSLLYLIQK